VAANRSGVVEKQPGVATLAPQEQAPPDLRSAGPPVGSILVADCGSSFSRVTLLELVETGYSFVAHASAPTTAEPPWSDVSAGVRHAVEQIEKTTGRVFIGDTGSLLIPERGGKGADLFVLTCSAGQPLRVVLAGLVRQISLASLERAAASAYTEVLGVITREYVGASRAPMAQEHLARDGLSLRVGAAEPVKQDRGFSDEDRIALIRDLKPDVVWVAGGTDGGSREPVRDLVETVALACTLTDSATKPAIVYAGNTELRSEIVELIGDEVDLQIIDNVRPGLNVENLATAQSAFQSAYIQRKVQALPGIGDLIGWSGVPVLSTAQAQSYLVLYLERLYEAGKGVLCADVGSANTSIATSFPARLQGRDGEESHHSLQVAADLGVGYGAQTLLERIGTDAIVRWLPFDPEPGEIEQVLLNKSVRPLTIPQERRELLVEQAAAREALRFVMERARDAWYGDADTAARRWTPQVDPIIVSGGILVNAPRPSQTVLMLLDAIEPVGITTLVLDRQGLAAALGAVALTQPLAAVQVLDAGAFETLGTVVAPVGRARPGEVVMTIKITFDRGGELEIEVKQGSIEVLPLRLGEKATLQLRPRRGISVGRVSGAVEVRGGLVGLVIDARGRPLRLSSDLAACHELAQQWLWDMGA
jgi:uncharacterized protein (TIGR01319 family)